MASKSALKLPSPKPGRPVAFDDLEEQRRSIADGLGEHLQKVPVSFAIDEYAESGQLLPWQIDA